MSEQLLALAAVVVLGVGAQWLAWRIRLPSILLLLMVGFLAGPVSGRYLEHRLLDPDELFGGHLLEAIVSISVALILYEGGLTLRFRELGEAGAVVGRLVSLGAVVTWLGAGAAAAWLLGLPPALAVLLGALLVVTGPTVIVPMLHQIRPRGRIGAILKWEGIVTDPIGAVLAVLVFEVILMGSPGKAASHVMIAVVQTVAVGGGLGVAAGFALAGLLRWFWVPDYLENAVSIMFVVGACTASNAIQPESGLLAATVMGVTLANQRLVDVKHILEFKENLRVLLISSLFIVLSAKLEIDALAKVGGHGLIFLAVLILVVRPVSVLVSAFRSVLTWREKLFAAVMAPRGIVAAAVMSVFALRLEAEGIKGAEILLPITFLVIIGTVLVYSLAAPPIAHALGVADAHPQGILFVGAHEWARAVASALSKLGFRVLLVDTNRADLAAARMAGLDACGESVLAEHLLDEIDLGGLGRLIAATPNDWVNILASQRFIRIFGRGEVYQVPARRDGDGADQSHRHLHGRWLFDQSITNADLLMRVRQGAVVKTTSITEEFTYERFRDHWGDLAVPLFIVSGPRKLQVITADEPAEPRPGDTLVSLVGPEQPPSRNAE